MKCICSFGHDSQCGKEAEAPYALCQPCCDHLIRWMSGRRAIEDLVQLVQDESLEIEDRQI